MLTERHERPQDGHVPTIADRWYVALDNRRVDVNGHSWVVQVDGIHRDGPDLWIQLSRVGFDDRGVVLQVGVDVDITAGLRALADHQEEIHPGDIVRLGGSRVR